MWDLLLQGQASLWLWHVDSRLGLLSSSLWCLGLVAPQQVGSQFPDQGNYVPCTGSWILKSLDHQESPQDMIFCFSSKNNILYKEVHELLLFYFLYVVWTLESIPIILPCLLLA